MLFSFFSTHHCWTGQDAIMSDISLLDYLAMVDRERVACPAGGDIFDFVHVCERLRFRFSDDTRRTVFLNRRTRTNKTNEDEGGMDGMGRPTVRSLCGPSTLPHVPHSTFVLYPKDKDQEWNRWVCVPLRAHFFFFLPCLD